MTCLPSLFTMTCQWRFEAFDMTKSGLKWEDKKLGSKKKETRIASEWTSESWLKLLLGHTIQYTISNTGRIYCKSGAPAQRDHNLQFVQTIELDQAFHFIGFYNGNKVSKLTTPAFSSDRNTCSFLRQLVGMPIFHSYKPSKSTEFRNAEK